MRIAPVNQQIANLFSQFPSESRLLAVKGDDGNFTVLNGKPSYVADINAFFTLPVGQTYTFDDILGNTYTVSTKQSLDYQRGLVLVTKS